MIRHRLVSRHQPLPLRVLLGCFELLASSALATVVITLSAVVLAWATLWVEWRHGTSAVQFAVYRSGWFAVLLALLGANVLGAALIRFPWRRNQIGFLIVHAGILVLLLGCWISRAKSINARLSLFEGERASRAVLDDRRELELTLRQSSSDNDHPTETIQIPFRPGPFNWNDYGQLAWFPWHWVRRDCGILYEENGVRVEVLDYYADSKRVAVPELRLRFDRDMTLRVRRLRTPHVPHRPLILGSRDRFAARTTFRMAMSRAETEAFLHSRPEGSLGRLGQVVLFTDGKKYPLLVEDLEDKRPAALGSSGIRVELERFDPESLHVVLKVYRPGENEPSGVLLLSAARVSLDQQDRENGVFGSFWFAPSARPPEKPSDAKDEKDKKNETKPETVIPPRSAWAAAEPRIDVLQGHDRRLYYRTSSNGRVETIDELPSDGSSIRVALGTDVPFSMSVESFLPAARPGEQVVPFPFDKDKPLKRERVKVRLSIDGNQREFWLGDPLGDDAEHSSGSVQGENRVATLKLTRPRVDLGFDVHLREFQRKFDPGTSRPSHYHSRVDFLSADEKAHPLKKDVVISLNRPAECADPASGRLFRLFQSGCDGPYAPEELPKYQKEKNDQPRDRVFRSHLTVAHDPGRLLKYAGCLMIVAGIVVMYYMKAYFFQPRRKA